MGGGIKKEGELSKSRSATITNVAPDGTTTITVPDGSVTNVASSGTTAPDGTTTYTTPKGTTVTKAPDGTTTITAPNEATIITDANGMTTITDPPTYRINDDGKVVGSDGNEINSIPPKFTSDYAAKTVTYDDGSVFDNEGTTKVMNIPNNPSVFTTNGDENDNIIYGYEGFNSILGLGGDDIIYGGNSRNILNGGVGNDIIYGGDNADGSNDILHGGIGDDLFIGGKGPDILYGNEGDDMLIGGHGDDKLYGGTGKDTFVYTQGDEGMDTIEDFEVGIDVLDLSDLLNYNVGDSYSFANFILVSVNDKYILTLDTDGDKQTDISIYIVVENDLPLNFSTMVNDGSIILM